MLEYRISIELKAEKYIVQYRISTSYIDEYRISSFACDFLH